MVFYRQTYENMQNDTQGYGYYSKLLIGNEKIIGASARFVNSIYWNMSTSIIYNSLGP